MHYLEWAFWILLLLITGWLIFQSYQAQIKRSKKEVVSQAINQSRLFWHFEVFDDGDGTFRGVETSSPCRDRSEAEKAAKEKLSLSWRLGKREIFLLVAPDGERYLYKPKIVLGDALNFSTGRRRCLICDKEMVKATGRNFCGGAGVNKETGEICPACRDSFEKGVAR